MRKYIVLVFLLCILCGVVHKKQTKQISYEIYYSSQSKVSYDLKYHLTTTFNDLVSDVHPSYYEVLIKDNISLFALKDCKVHYDNKIVLIQGDGKGEKISGNLKTYQNCMPEVKPKSLIVELIDN